jgi:hypothetical protein
VLAHELSLGTAPYVGGSPRASRSP